MVDEVMVRRAAETAWTVYRAAHPGVDVQDSRRCLLERYLHRRREEREIDAEEHQLRDSLPAPASRRRMLTGMKMFVARVVRESTRPSWTLLAISYLISAVIVIALRFVVGA
ncbi:hypothetical protein [Bradyrhizobium japonicum]|uniref:hypothetical protein n=1 Tax=Bradyrhizobium japonicum TaxID=375 RepID=UPI0004569E5B|nr:hypothetical protein [Bradyrhizobium japonicum]AHY50695.1 hypothetical protein BJS_03542 [Bradyrhizobium japonicum SEMIA 5079]MCD9104531.1 hypothetical protein [Bradyrhizobium japonicum]MCD9260381.1 hypothetical protein [Bradyrhizobium japonicum SEMIA 5079]MCD9819861.1 hypothetical protein [Bradyrhizobium japonicum]MCD9895368.1 hypothetical protein [Bradyrhizobium japonicum]